MKAQPKPEQLPEPTQEQIKNCAWLGWHYTGGGYFIRGDEIGWFEDRNFIKE